MRGDGEFKIIGYVDSDFATDPVTRQSVTGYFIFIGNSLVCWKSKQKVSTTLSSTEAEYVAMSHCATEMMFVRNLLMDIGFDKVGMVMREDNASAMFLAKNMATGNRKNHIDTCCHYVRELVERKLLEIVFVMSRNNLADLLTKNLSFGLFKRFTEAVRRGEYLSLEEGRMLRMEGNQSSKKERESDKETEEQVKQD